MAPRLFPSLVKPELVARDTDPDYTFQGHKSEEVAKAIQSYVVAHQDQPWQPDLSQTESIPTNDARLSSVKDTSILATMPSLSSSPSAATLLAPVISISDLVHAQYWMSILLCIVWIISGLFLLFFGWSSFFWGTTFGNSRKRIQGKTKRANRCGPLFAGAPIAGGVGGIVVGFLFFSFLAVVITSAICVAQIKSVSSTSFFIIWLLPGLLGAFLAGHWPVVARAFTGLLAGGCFTLIVTAMFGIHTLIIRAIFVSVSTTLITAPLLVPRRNVIHFHLLNVCTSIIGMVTFLDGVALFAPPRASSSAWIDLWVLLFAADNSTSELSATKKWGTSAFKGFIAAAVLGAIVGCLFEFFFHKHAAEDPDMEWNNYLGSFTERLENQEASSPQDRLGSFEPAPSAWQKISRVFAKQNQPAAYGNISTCNDPEKSPLTDLPGPKSRPERATKTRRGPARFQALDKRGKHLELSDSDSDSTDYDSDSSLHKLKTLGKAVSATSLLSKAGVDELVDELRPLSEGADPRTDNAIRSPRPPSYRTSSINSGGSTTGSDLGRTAANSASEAWRHSDSNRLAEKVVDVGRVRDGLTSPIRPTFSRHATMSPPPPFAAINNQVGSPLSASIPATPSLVNAITRIQVAQAQARAWYETCQDQATVSAGTKPSDSKSQHQATQNSSETCSTSKQHFEPSETSGTTSPSVKHQGDSFQKWWGNQVKASSKPSA